MEVSSSSEVNTRACSDLFRYYHYAMGKLLSDIVDISWQYVLKEKSEDMIHVLQFPYNGESPRVSLYPVHYVAISLLHRNAWSKVYRKSHPIGIISFATMAAFLRLTRMSTSLRLRA